MNGGNIDAILQVNAPVENIIGEAVDAWHDVIVLKEGFLDFVSGDSKYITYNAKIQESTHVFLCDYKPIPDIIEVDGKSIRVHAENARMVANSQSYDVMVIDDPMNMHKHLEIYLKYTGGQ